jgi:signal transduction histidine kinase
VRRIIGLITQMTEASRSARTIRELADFAARTLVELFPKSSAAVFERDPRAACARVVGGANVPPAWVTRVLPLCDVPLLDEALQYPERVIDRAVRQRQRGASGDAHIAGRLQMLCAAVPQVGEMHYALMFLAPPAPSEAPVREVAIEITRQLLGASAVIEGAGRSRMLGAIHRAKREWEHMVDTLPEIVGLLDSRWHVIRVSRAVERWQLGPVRDAIGRDLHSLLHPTCPDPACPLGASLEVATRALSRAAHARFEIADPVLSADLTVTLNAAVGSGGGGPPEGWHRVAFSVENVTSLRSAERELKLLNHTLEQRVEDRAAELLVTNRALWSEVKRRREVEKSLRRSTRDLEALSERLMNAQEAERKRISQDLHDSVGQMLSAIKYSLERAQVLSRREAPDEASGVIEVAIRRVQRLMDEVRSISMNLRPALLDDLGAASAVRGLCRDWQDVYRGIEVETDIAVLDAEIPAILVTSVFRAVQESLNNVARHAAAQHVRVSIRITAGVLRVLVQDDGAGFEIDDGSSPASGTRGLRGLRERAARTGGCFDVSSAPGQGTVVQLEWPVAAGLAAHIAQASLN